jgi:glutamyl/glutaminyl-tRNA synthetase
VLRSELRRQVESRHLTADGSAKVTIRLTMTPRVRFAPSPTGYLILAALEPRSSTGSFARRLGGVLVLRSKTPTSSDRRQKWSRGSSTACAGWVSIGTRGPKVDGPYAPYFQSERLDRYRAMAARLVAQGSAYYCYCTPEQLKAKRQQGRRKIRSHLLWVDRGRDRCTRKGRHAAGGSRARSGRRDALRGSGARADSNSMARTSRTS